MKHLRWNPLLGEWIIVSPRRKNRFNKKNPFASDSPEMVGKEVPTILENKYPNFSIQSSVIDNEGFFVKKAAYGFSDVLVESSNEKGDFDDYSVNHIFKILNLIRERTSELYKKEKIKYVFVFKNKGKEVGSSIPHPHMQIYGMPYVPKIINKEIKNCEEHFDKTGNSLFQEIIDQERKDNQRIIIENKDFITFIPFFARWAYEISIMSKSEKQNIIELSNDSLINLAQSIKSIIYSYHRLFSHKMSYVMLFHQSPVGEDLSFYRFHINIQPIFQGENLLKHTAGIERMGTFELGSAEPEYHANQIKSCLNTK